MDDAAILITGARGQLGVALRAVYPGAAATDSSELDITNKDLLKQFNWDKVKVIINAAAYTNVDGAETEDGKRAAWAVNDEAVGNLAEIAAAKDLLLVHVSTDYVFDGYQGPHKENEPLSPLGEYGKSKAAGDKKAAQAPKNYIIRTSWVIGDGKNFVRTMLGLGRQGVAPTVVADQIGRPSFTSVLAKAIKFLIDNQAGYGTYNVTNEGRPVSWADLTREIFKLAGIEQEVTDTTANEYFASKPDSAPRPLNSVMDLSKIESLGYEPRDWRDDLADYIRKELEE